MNDSVDANAGMLLSPLDREPTRPSTVDIAAAMRDGQRRRRLRRVAAYSTTVAATALALVGASLAAGTLRGGGPAHRLAASASAAPSRSPTAGTEPSRTPPSSLTAPAPLAPTRCTISRLPIPGGVAMALVTGADPTGRFLLGRSYPPGRDYQVIVWHDGVATKVPLRGSEPALEDVTSTGVAVGAMFERVPAETDGLQLVAYVYRAGGLAPLPGISYGQAYGINEAEQIVGVDEQRHRPVRWASPSSPATDLPLPAGVFAGEARDIDEDGTVVGNVRGGDNVDRPHVWFPDGSHRDLPVPAVSGLRANGARVHSIRNGWATGVLNSAGVDRPSALRWNVHTGEVRVFEEFLIRASTANVHGWQVGTDRQGRALFLADGRPVVLPDLANHRPGELTNIASTVSDDGRIIAGQADDKAGTIHAVVWHCS